MTTTLDAVIVGGGPAGSTAAMLLAKSGWRVALVEHTRFPRRKVCGEYISASTWTLLMQLGVGTALASIAGPPVTRVGLFARSAELTAPIGNRRRDRFAGRAVGREHLDAALLDAASAAGAGIHQPSSFIDAQCDDGRCVSLIEHRETGQRIELESSIIIDAHGAWETNALSRTPRHESKTDERLHATKRTHHQSDLLGFKAHFEHADLPQGLMPLLAFPGGYGGMVATDRGRTSLSLCIRRDRLAQCRRQQPGASAGEAVLAHIRSTCGGVDAALSRATLDDRWLAAGPLDTGIRGFGHGRVFAVGNAAAEAHPVIAEGISMAIQSSALLAQVLVARGGDARRPDVASLDDAAIASARTEYERAWRAHFALRVRAAAFFAHLFMRPLPTAIAAASVRALPVLLTLGASFSGKSSRLPPGALGAMSSLASETR